MKPWLDQYPDGDLHGLLNLEDRYRIDSLVCCLEQRIGLKSILTDDDSFILAICSFDREVNNGGFEQYLMNSSREFAHRLAGDLKRIKLAEASEKVLEIYSLIGLSSQPSEESISELVDSDAWDESEEARGHLERFDDYYFDAIGDCSEPLWNWLKGNNNVIEI